MAKKYDPNQPRVPKGKPTGGEWTATQPSLFEKSLREGAGLNEYEEKVATVGKALYRNSEVTVYKVNKFKEAPKQGTLLAYKIKGEKRGEIISARSTDGDLIHGQMVRAAYGESEDVDTFVRLWVDVFGTIRGSLTYAGVPLGYGASESEISKAVDNMYKALDKLTELGLPKGTKIEIGGDGFIQNIITTI